MVHRSFVASASSTPTTRPLRAVVVGGGPGGLSTAIALANARGPRPWKVDLFEKRPLHEVTDGTDERRTYGMVIGAERALGPLVGCGVDVRKVVGSRRLIATAVFPGAAASSVAASPSSPSSSPSASSGSPAPPPPPPPPPRMIMPQVSEDDADVDEPTARGALFMVDRAHLVSSLAAHVEEELSSSVSLHWGAPLASLDTEAQVVRFEGGGGEGDGIKEERHYDLLVACDGGSSAVRRALAEAGLIEITQLPSPVSLTHYKTFHGLDDAGADELGLDTSGRGSTFAMFVAPPPVPGVKGAAYPGSMAVHRRPGGRGWSGLLSQPPGVLDSLRGSPPGAYAPLLDGILGVQVPAFPASWRSKILAQLAAEPGAAAEGGGGDVGRLATLLRASALSVPGAGVALVGDAATTNTPQLGQGAASAIEDAAMLAAEVTRSLVESEKERTTEAGSENGDGDEEAAAAAAAAAERRTKAAVARGLQAYDSKRRRARYALQDMERELAVTNRPPPVDEPAEDAEARAAWKAFFEEGKKRAVKRAALRRKIARLLPFSRRARVAAHVTDFSWWNEMLHSTTPYDVIYENVRGGRGGAALKSESNNSINKRSIVAAAGVAAAAAVAAVALSMVRKA